VQKRVASSCMTRKRHEKTFETLLQAKERLTRELRLRTEKRIEELLEPGRLAVIENEAVSYDLEPHGLNTYKPKVAVRSSYLELDRLFTLGCCVGLRVLV
jgi:hypothetical protein